MGTRSTIKFYQRNPQGEDRKFLGAMYQQFDGYPDAVGLELALFLNKMELINGIQKYDNIGVQANGVGCLVAQFIKLGKKSVGGFYMTTEDDSQEWNYIIENTWGKSSFDITVEGYHGIEFQGNQEEFLMFCGGTLDMIEPDEEDDLAVVDEKELKMIE